MSVTLFGRLPELRATYSSMADVARAAPESSQSSIELEERTPVRDQLLDPRLGACTPCAFTTALEHIDVKGRRFSALAAYNFAAEVEGWPLADNGCRMSTMLHVLRDMGLPLEEDWPYRPSEFFRGVPLWVRERAYDMPKVAGYVLRPNVDVLDLVEMELLFDHKVLWGYSVSASFSDWRPGGRNFHEADVLDPPIRAVGSHTSCIVGVRNREEGMRREWKVQNSFGAGWGVNGYFWVSSEYLLDPWNEFGFLLPTPESSP